MRQRLTQRFPNKEMVRERFAHNQGLMYIVVAFFVCVWTTALCLSVAESCGTLYDLTDCSVPGCPVLHRLLEFAQVHVH